MKPITLFLDMDGVLANFDDRYEKIFGVQTNKLTKDEWDSNWEKWVESKAFENLDWFKGARDLFEFARELKETGQIDRLEILSASGGQPFHDRVAKQKTLWLKSHGLFKHLDAVNIVESGLIKGEYAHHRTILIDDTRHVIRNFRNCGGIGLLHGGEIEDIMYQVKMVLKLSRFWGRYDEE